MKLEDMTDPHDLKLIIKQALKEALEEDRHRYVYCTVCHKKIYGPDDDYGVTVTFHILHDECFKSLKDDRYSTEV